MNAFGSPIPIMKKSAVCAFVLFGLLSSSALAQSAPKLGYVDAQEVVLRSKAGKAAMQGLETLKEKKQERMNEKQKEAESLERDLQAQRFTLAADERERRQDEIQKQRKELQRMLEDAQGELDREEQKALKKIEIDVMKVIAEIGKKEGYTLIFGKIASSIVYADPSADLTDKIVAAYDSAHASQ
ncbi:MAG: OmpH family outer membrane protein [Candidatus Schekmanbacteria bacterium]|nr:OmpH family outer membrane protein [Candidatus Schekmanbacteria bacterium]